ncbi:MAG: DUF6232 family protein [Chloroflexi bacterium]|nr:DUF6232 family protein [Chloroflexota bacterium]
MVVSKDRVLLKEHGTLVTYERFVAPDGKEYRIEDILSVEMEVVEEESDRPPIGWWRTVGGGGIIGIAVAAVGGFAGAWLTMGIFVVLVAVAVTWWGNRIRSNKFKVYHVIVTLPAKREDRQEHRIVSSTSRFFSERLKVALERAIVERPARYENR